MRPSVVQQKILLAMANGDVLKSHRYLDGTKVFQLHRLDGRVETVHRSTIEALQDRRLIDSNKKFPVATYWLTDRGQRLSASISSGSLSASRIRL